MKTELNIENWIDRMGLIVALSGETRFEELNRFKLDLRQLSIEDQDRVRLEVRNRLPSSDIVTSL